MYTLNPSAVNPSLTISSPNDKRCRAVDAELDHPESYLGIIVGKRTKRETRKGALSWT